MDKATQLMMEEIAEQTADRAVNRTLMSLGIDTSNPIAAQRNMASLSKISAMFDDDEYRRDQVHLRKWRTAFDKVESKGMSIGISLLIVMVVGAIVLGSALKHKLIG